MIMSKKISVIVPIYKVEPYLRKCVDSIICQTYKNLEIILVDDGSPDNCGLMCDEYAKQDTRVRVIHKTNGGLSDARNAGLDIVTGEYIAFVDSDDWIEPFMYEKLLDNMVHFNADMAVCGVSDDIEKNNGYQRLKVSNYGISVFAENNIEAMKRYFYGSWAAWDKLYRTDLFEGIRYPIGEINEDEAIVLQLLEKCRVICYTNTVCYHYVRREASITTSAFSIQKLAWYRHCKANFEWIRTHHPELTNYAAARYRSSILWSLTEMAMAEGDYGDEVDNLLKELRNNKDVFLNAPFQHKTDCCRMQVLLHLPFNFYKYAIKIKRGFI